MDALPLAQKIKIIKDANLKIPVYRAPSENYDPDRPSKFDKDVYMETVQVAPVISALLGIITFLSKELMLCGKPIPKDTWRKLNQIRDLVRDQHSSIRMR